MSEATMRLRNMRTQPGQSLHELQLEVIAEAEATFAALRRLLATSLNYLPAQEGEVGDAVEDAINALALCGDRESIQSNQECGITSPHPGGSH